MLFINMPILKNIIYSPNICGFCEYLYRAFVIGLFSGALQNIINADIITITPTTNKDIPISYYI